MPGSTVPVVLSSGNVHARKVRQQPYMSWKLVLAIYALRLFLCVTVRTVEAPDEWWQSTEVAYNMVFGKGHLPWEWHNGLRSVIFPGIVAIPFFILKVLGTDTAWSVWFASRALQALILSSIDICVFNIGASLDVLLAASRTERSTKGRETLRRRQSSTVSSVPGSGASFERSQTHRVAHTALMLSLGNWYMAYCGVRLYSNVLEALLVLLAMQQKRYIPFLLLSGLASAVRITSVVVIFPLLFVHIWRAVRKYGCVSGLLYITSYGALALALVLGITTSLDRLFYGHWVLTPLAFFRFNVSLNLSRFFGEHAWHFYIFPVLPFIVGPHILFTFLAPFLLRRGTFGAAVRLHIYSTLGLCFWIVGIYSLIDHKECRFIFTVLPLCLVIAAFVLSRWYSKYCTVRRLHRIFLLLNVVGIYVMCYVFRRGPLDVMAEIRGGAPVGRLDIIATCYTTPGYSYVHKKVDHLGHIDCSVRIDNVTGVPKVTEDVIFRRYPKDYVLWKYDGVHTFNMSDADERTKATELREVVPPRSRPHPEALVMTRALAIKVKEAFLSKHRYRLYRSFLHSPLILFPFEDNYIELWVRAVDN
ncbi:putative Alg9 like mannosyltransferase family [Trypanosoma vivax]|nr:GPI anchor biosynthesis protein [Trypanosoma vivax]KAH8611469.1 putative Alg9 like mannosyltransferase family [Trypanosoma vivax]